MAKKAKPRTRRGRALRHAPRITLPDVLSRISDTVSVIDRQWRVLYANESALGLARRKPEDVLGRNMWELYPDLVGSEIEQHYRRALAEQRPETFETYYAPLDVWVELRLHPSPQQLVVFGRDITARKKAELALAASERRFRRIVETAHEGIWLVDEDYRTAWLNPRMVEILGAPTAEAIIGRSVAEFVYEADRPKLRQQIEQRRLGVSADYDIRLQRLDGAMFWAYARIAPIMGDNGEFRGALGMISDITARKVAEQQLGDQREWFRVTLSSIGDAVMATDAEGRITFMNPVAESLTGWTVGDAAGRPVEQVFRIVQEGGDEPVESPVARVLREHRVVGLANHTELIARDGSRRPIDDSGAPIIGSRGEIAGVVLVFRDGTERRRTEDTLREADRRKDEFLAMLGHELRNPLAPIASALEIMRLAPGDVAGVTRSRQVIERQLQHMTRLVDDLLDIARITRGRIVLHRRVTAVDALVARALETVRPMLERHNQRLEQSAPPAPIHADVDATRMAQVIANLLHNASKFSPDGATLSLNIALDGNTLIIEVRDPGRGIDAALLPRVFEPFVQGAPPDDRNHGGLGLGLALVKNLVAMHGGRVAAESAGAGRGATFRAWLPVVVPEPRTEPAEAPVRVAARLRILVVDDNVDAADTLANLLRIVGHDVVVAYEAQGALDELNRRVADMAVLDIGLPRINGYDFARQLRANPAFAGMKLVALSGYGQDDDRRRSLAAGFDTHLVKPIDIDALNRTIALLFPPTPLPTVVLSTGSATMPPPAAGGGGSPRAPAP